MAHCVSGSERCIDEYTGPQARYYDRYFTGVEGDLEFYLQAAKQAGSPILELGSGSGRILLPLAESGIHVVGIERSAEMLGLLRGKLAGLPAAQRRCLRFLASDMRAFALQERFRLAIAPYRVFQHLLNDDEQLQCLDRVRQHLHPRGAFVLNLFDPGELGEQLEPHLDARFSVGDRDCGHVVEVRFTRSFERSEQLLCQQLIFDEIDSGGTVRAHCETTLTLRYNSRRQTERLLAASGFEVAALYGGFRGEAPQTAGEQVWIAVKR